MPGLEAAIGPHHDTAAQIIEHQRLVRISNPDFPRATGVLDRTNGACSRAAIVPADEHYIGIGLGHACSHRAHACATDQLHADLRARIDLLKVIDKLSKILNGVNIVMRRRRNKWHPRHTKTQLGNHLSHLVTRQLTPLAGLGSLRHFDLNFLGTGQIFGSYAKTTAGNLLDGAIFLGAITLGTLAALAAVRFSADFIHGLGQALVCFGRQCAAAHSCGGKPGPDIFDGLNFLQRHRLGVIRVLE